MNYTRKSFSVGVGSDAYRSGWEAIFGKRKQYETKPLVLANESFDRVAEMVADPPPPNAALKRASRRKGSK